MANEPTEKPNETGRLGFDLYQLGTKPVGLVLNQYKSALSGQFQPQPTGQFSCVEEIESLGGGLLGGFGGN